MICPNCNRIVTWEPGLEEAPFCNFSCKDKYIIRLERAARVKNVVTGKWEMKHPEFLVEWREFVDGKRIEPSALKPINQIWLA